jgi:hypothetical protein
LLLKLPCVVAQLLKPLCLAMQGFELLLFMRLLFAGLPFCGFELDRIAQFLFELLGCPAFGFDVFDGQALSFASLPFALIARFAFMEFGGPALFELLQRCLALRLPLAFELQFDFDPFGFNQFRGPASFILTANGGLPGRLNDRRRGRSRRQQCRRLGR